MVSCASCSKKHGIRLQSLFQSTQRNWSRKAVGSFPGRLQNKVQKEVATFIEEMEAIGDVWTPDQVEDVYGDSTLEETLADRKGSLGTFFDIIVKVINRD